MCSLRRAEILAVVRSVEYLNILGHELFEVLHTEEVVVVPFGVLVPEELFRVREFIQVPDITVEEIVHIFPVRADILRVQSAL